MVLVAARAFSGLSYSLPLSLLVVIFVFGEMKSFIRLRSVELPLAKYKKELRKTLPAHLLLWPLTSALFLYNSLAAMLSRRIEWRGITYELKSPTEAVIIRDTDLT
jgi:hypothetical protein